MSARKSNGTNNNYMPTTTRPTANIAQTDLGEVVVVGASLWRIAMAHRYVLLIFSLGDS